MEKMETCVFEEPTIHAGFTSFLSGVISTFDLYVTPRETIQESSEYLLTNHLLGEGDGTSYGVRACHHRMRRIMHRHTAATI
jgi:hypothetical protein